jgi:hypothetical protein
MHGHHYIVSSWARISRGELALAIDRIARYEIDKHHGHALFLLRNRRRAAAAVYARRFGALPDFLRAWTLPVSATSLPEYARWLNAARRAPRN